ncbi:hypothetical protein [Rhizobium rhizogenes]|uniref:hypothetical protein n=1 Tax=Rhizobium rhizogenes TaxID=359 RepID=UPI0015738474|nr:hypothetical protein [Rhizobium rhizogenes]NTF67959.1 hypothetical protein [Rhizobium rhizogenes]
MVENQTVQIVSDNAELSDWFDHMPGIGYIVMEIIDGERVCYLYNGEGEALIGSRSGMVPLINFAINRDMTLLTRH